MKTVLLSMCRVAAAFLFCVTALGAPGDYWLQSLDISSYELGFDHDGDGFITRDEYYFGTDPRGAGSKPPTLLPFREENSFVLSWPSVLGATYSVTHSFTLSPPAWQPTGTAIAGTGLVLAVESPIEGGSGFFRLEATLPGDSDGDGLSAVEEAQLGTNAGVADTDGDGLTDGVEIFQTFTNPLVADPGGGTISGQVKTDPNGDGSAADGAPVAGAEVYLDVNYDGEFDPGDPKLTTGADGRYTFTHLRPGVYHLRQELAAGQLQTVPMPAASPVLNGLPDEVMNYTHALGGNLPVPYGAKADQTAVTPYIIFPPVAKEVSPDVVLQPIGRRDEIPAAGIWSFNDHLTIPQNASILLRFDETIIDKPGADFVIYKLTQGAGEEATLEVGYTPGTMVPVTTITDANGGNTAARPIDLSAFNIPGPIRYIRLTSLNNAGTFKGFEFVGVEGVHFAQPDAQAREVIVLGTEAHPDNDFARHFRDDPPTVFVFVNGNDFRAGQSTNVTVQAEDDIAVATRTLTANGVTVSLDGNGNGTVALTAAGTVTLVATATDSAGQASQREAVLYVNNADGTSPFSSNLTGANAGSGFEMRFVTPASGAIVGGNTAVIANLAGVVTPNWVLDFAPVASINPYDLAASDPDWITLGSGSGFLTNQSAGTFPATSLPNGIYFLRLSATPTNGGTTAYHGQVVAKGVAPEDIQPRVTITTPAQGRTVPLIVPITGSITSTRPLVEWFAEYAPAERVDVQNLGSDEPPWKRFAAGTTTIANNLIANFDASLVTDGSYIIRIVAWNDIRLGWAEPLPIEVAGGGFKPGQLRREFTDLNLPVGGIPFTIRRIYDSLDASKDEGLGFGWKLAFLDPGIGETVARTGSGLFGATPFRDGTRVYINTPEGKRVGFTFHAEAGVASFVGTVYRAIFTPDPGVYEKLETPEGADPFLTVDGNGNASIYLLGFAWNPSTYILTTSDGTRYTYEETLGFTEARDMNGNTLVATANGLRHSTGAAIEFVRNGAGRITQINAPDGVSIIYGYDVAGDLTSVADDGGLVTTLGYYAAPAHYLKDVTDPLGRVGTTYEYDATGRLVAVIDEDGKRAEQAWNPGGFSGTITDRNGNVTSLVYNERGNVITETNALGQTTTFAYADPANPDKQTSRTDALGRVTQWTYDARGKTTEIKRPISLNETFAATYDAAGRMLTARSFDGQQSSYAWDTRGNLASADPADGPAETYAYSPEGKLATVTTANSAAPAPFTTQFTYTTEGRLQSIRDDHGFSVQTTLLANGDLTGATLAGGRTYAFTFDADGTPSTETDPFNRSTSLTLEPDGTRKKVDRLGRATRYRIAADESLELITRADGTTTTPGHDPERNLTSLTDSAANTSQWQYDALNRPTRFTDATGAFIQTIYDAAGNVIERVNRNGKRRTFLHDANDRITHERWHDAGGAVIREFRYFYFEGGLNQITDGAGTWDILGDLPRPSRIAVTYPGQVRRNLNYSWDANGVPGSGECCGGDGGDTATVSPTRVLISGGADNFSNTASYNGPHLSRLQWSPPGAAAGAGQDIQFIRGEDGLVSEIRRIRGSSSQAPPKSRTTYSWDSLGRLASYSHLDLNGAALHADAPAAFTRDAESRITAIARVSDTTGYSYDLVDQLTGVTHTAGAVESYTYDAMGVRTASHLDPGPSTVGAANRLLTAGALTFTYDAEGNVLTKTDSASGQVTRYEYDHRDQLTRATIHPNAVDPPTTTLEFAYDYARRLISRSIAGAKTWILYDRKMPIGEFADGADVCNAAFLYSPDRLDDFHGVWRASAGVRLLLKDHLGTVQGATDADGALIYWAKYDAFGNLLGVPPAGIETIRFAGRFWSEALGLYEVRERFYDPALGRFTQEDPIGFRGGDMNLYRYAGNNPIGLRDPTGRVAALEYVELTVGIVRPAGLCAFASCVSNLWAGVANAVVNQIGSTAPPRNCALELFGVPSKMPDTTEAALTGYGFGSEFGGGSPPGVDLVLEGISFAKCMAEFGE